MSEYIPGELADNGQGYEEWYNGKDREVIEEESEDEE